MIDENERKRERAQAAAAGVRAGVSSKLGSIWWLIAGIGQIFTARRMPADDPDRGAVTTIGIAAAIVGLVLVFWPSSGIVVISWVIGIAGILIGALLIYLGSRFKRLKARVGMLT
ncbi:MAG: DUF308 domain-containing protein [Pseudolabrys sp.]